MMVNLDNCANKSSLEVLFRAVATNWIERKVQQSFALVIIHSYQSFLTHTVAPLQYGIISKSMSMISKRDRPMSLGSKYNHV